MNSAASVRARLLNASKAAGENFQAYLTRYAIERFLFRLGQSDQYDNFLLKGAMLFVAWEGNLHRPTKDLDLLGYGQPTLEDVSNRIRRILEVPGDDGLLFEVDTIQTERIREEANYEGVRATFLARLEQARISMQVDIGFGDAVAPEVVVADFPVMLAGIEAPHLRMYPAETVIAEKFHSMVELDIRNSRMKDFYDIWHLSRSRSFEASRVSAALRATFDRRGTSLPNTVPFALTAGFLQDQQKIQQWLGFIRRLQLKGVPELQIVGSAIREFLWPVIAVSEGAEYWRSGGPWAEVE